MGIGDKQLTPATCNMVQTDQIWKDYVRRESQAVKYWDKKWGFLTAEYRLIEKEAKKRRSSSSIMDTLKLPPLPGHVPPRGDVPCTTSGEVGWRLGKRENLLERYGRMARPKRSILKQLGWPRDAMP